MIRLDCRFPGGNIKVHDIKGDEIFVSPDLRDTRTSWFYWAFRVTGAAGRQLLFRFISDMPVGPRGPAISTDDRKTWHRSSEPFDESSFRVTIPQNAETVYLAFAPTYTQENWETFIAELSATDNVADFEVGTICKSRKGRPVELLHIGPCADKASCHIVITARHHCCEMIANFVMEGIIRDIALSDSAESGWLRNNASISFIPFVDKDGVEDGDQGKNRAPHDHNRDYGPTIIYPETASVIKLMNAISARYGHVDMFMDLHCPWIRSDCNEYVYIVGSKYEKHAKQQKLFGSLVEHFNEPGSLPFFAKDTYLFGTGWNVLANTSDGESSTSWAGGNCAVNFSTSFEIPYANARDVLVTPCNTRMLGSAISRAMAAFIRSR